MKSDVHWPEPSVTVWTPGWIDAEPAGAQLGAADAAAGASAASAPTTTSTAMSRLDIPFAPPWWRFGLTDRRRDTPTPRRKPVENTPNARVQSIAAWRGGAGAAAPSRGLSCPSRTP